MIDIASGYIYTIAGTGVAGYNGDGELAASAQLNTPADVIVDNHNNIYIADWFNNRIRRIDAIYYPTSIQNKETKISDFSIYPNPSNGNVSFKWVNQKTGTAKVIVSDILGRSVYQSNFEIAEHNGIEKFDFSFLNNGIYQLVFSNKNINFSDCLILSK